EVANPKALRGLNEIGHMVLSRAINIANGAWRHEAEVFAEKIFALAIRYGCIFELENAISFASENFKID
ncbi:MAG: hypothetical protein RL748_4079, partial [Pseudomonadota bacterium]